MMISQIFVNICCNYLGRRNCFDYGCRAARTVDVYKRQILQTYVVNGDIEQFLSRFDTDWQRYNRDIIRTVQEYEEENGSAE